MTPLSGMSVTSLVLVLAGIAAIFVLVKGLNVPQAFHDSLRRRAEIRRKLLSVELRKTGQPEKAQQNSPEKPAA